MQELTREQVTKMVETNFQSAIVNTAIENAEMLRGHYKHKQNKEINIGLKFFAKVFIKAKLNEDEMAHLVSVTDAFHDAIYALKLDYRKQIEETYKIIG